MCVYVYATCLHVCGCPQRPEKYKVQDLLELDLQVLISLLTRKLGTKLKGPLKEQQVLLIAKLSFQPPKWSVAYWTVIKFTLALRGKTLNLQASYSIYVLEKV